MVDILSFPVLLINHILFTLLILYINWPVLLPFVLHTLMASIFNFKDNPLDKPQLLYIPVLSFFVTSVVILWGVIFTCIDREGFTWRTNFLHWLLLLNIPMAILLIVYAKGFRWFTFSIVLLQGWVSAVAVSVSVMFTTCDIARL